MPTGISEELVDIVELLAVTEADVEVGFADIEVDQLTANDELFQLELRILERDDVGFPGGWSGPIGPAGEVYVEVGFEPLEVREVLFAVVLDPMGALLELLRLDERIEMLPELAVKGFDDEALELDMLEEATGEQVPNAD